jgi:hypothetical protein
MIAVVRDSSASVVKLAEVKNPEPCLGLDLGVSTPAHLGKLFILEFDDELLPIIKKAIHRHAIRGADSVHLASTLWLRSVLKEDVVFPCADARLLDAARAERLVAYDPE